MCFLVFFVCFFSQLHIMVSSTSVKLNVDCQEVAEKTIKAAGNTSSDGYQVLGKMSKTIGSKGESSTVSQQWFHPPTVIFIHFYLFKAHFVGKTHKELKGQWFHFPSAIGLQAWFVIVSRTAIMRMVSFPLERAASLFFSRTFALHFNKILLHLHVLISVFC